MVKIAGSQNSQVVYGTISGCSADLDNTQTVYIMFGGTNNGTSESLRAVPVPFTGLIKNLRVNMNLAPGAGKNWTFTLRVNGADTAITVTIANAATNGTDLTHVVSVTKGDLLSWKCVPTTTPAAARAVLTVINEVLTF
jgi:hypothetical protein